MSRDELKKLKSALKRRGWTQEAIAAELRRSQSHVSLVLAGRRQSRSLLSKIHELTRRSAPAGLVVP